MKIEAHAAARHELVEDRQHLHLHGDVEGRGRLVGDQQVGLGGQHHRDHHALAHAARDLVRIDGVDPLRVADAHRLQHLQGPAAGLAAADAAACDAHGLVDLAADASSPG